MQFAPSGWRDPADNPEYPDAAWDKTATASTTPMNMHALASRAVASINPMTMGTIQPSGTTYTTAPDGTRTTNRPPAQTVPMQVQALTVRDLQHLDGLNIQGSTDKLYMTGRIWGTDRNSNRGGDLVTLADGRTFLVTAVLEQWPDWVSAAVTLQRG